MGPLDTRAQVEAQLAKVNNRAMATHPSPLWDELHERLDFLLTLWLIRAPR